MPNLCLLLSSIKPLRESSINKQKSISQQTVGWKMTHRKTGYKVHSSIRYYMCRVSVWAPRMLWFSLKAYAIVE